ncbi:fibrobacter succinogenes major paralogous domain-containing protein [Shewanella sp. KJ10-1]|uniref:Fibrobacter succinogenes major paralogous domain-containing protein n=1 Tax=Shewanella phaeophyticola TaxID=2978345 RepID=A0ABT2P4L1_9GAMM|nr:fibrobacter succinogenes major paralogous domain-containing protein [Shewanella sp. KJ10-1]MCT8987563.1 fibrobacter succinogenes major paralogous domain-containing protein [Shewanella sp. KJ10-1]
MKQLILSIGACMVMASTAASASGINSELHKLDNTVQDREGNVYLTVSIGDQVWLAENLRSTQFQDGSAVRSGAVLNNDAANLLTYGRLYNWHDVSDERNLALRAGELPPMKIGKS